MVNIPPSPLHPQGLQGSNWGSYSSSRSRVAVTLHLSCSGRAGVKIDCQEPRWTARQTHDIFPGSAEPLPLDCCQGFLCWQTRRDFSHLKSCTGRRWLPPKKVISGCFLKVEYLKRVFLACVDGAGPAMASTPGLCSPIGSTQSLKQRPCRLC